MCNGEDVNVLVYNCFLVFQTQFQRLVLRMTRFYTREESGKVWTRLKNVVKARGYESRTSADEVSQ